MTECCIIGCARSSHARGMCELHYGRWRRMDSDTRPERPGLSAAEVAQLPRYSAHPGPVTWPDDVQDAIEPLHCIERIPNRIPGDHGFRVVMGDMRCRTAAEVLADIYRRVAADRERDQRDMARYECVDGRWQERQR